MVSSTTITEVDSCRIVLSLDYILILFMPCVFRIARHPYWKQGAGTSCQWRRISRSAFEVRTYREVALAMASFRHEPSCWWRSPGKNRRPACQTASTRAHARSAASLQSPLNMLRYVQSIRFQIVCRRSKTTTTYTGLVCQRCQVTRGRETKF